MSISESFDNSAFDQPVPDITGDFPSAWMPVIAAIDPDAQLQPGLGRDQLLPVDAVRQEGDVEVLRQELETAHQILRDQQGLIESLTQQLASRDTHLQQVETDLAITKQRCTRQAEKQADIEAVCQDLRTQLRRQQQRINEYKSALERQTSPVSPLTPQGVVSFSYGSNAIAAKAPDDSQAPPVPTWPAADAVDLTGPLAIYQKLVAFGVPSPTAPVRNRARHHVRLEGGGDDQHWIAHPTPESQVPAAPPQPTIRVELPSFTRSRPAV